MGICCIDYRMDYHVRQVSLAGLPKHELKKENNSHAKDRGTKITRFQAYTRKQEMLGMVEVDFPREEYTN